MLAIKKKNKAPDKAGTFRVLTGSHLGDCPQGCECDGATTNHCFDSYEVYSKETAKKGLIPLPPGAYIGDLIPATIDLERRLGSGKFKRVADDEVARLVQAHANATAEPEPVPEAEVEGEAPKKPGKRLL